MKSACFTGHRPDKLGGYDRDAPLNRAVRDELDRVVEDLSERGVEHWCSGMAIGVDMWGAEAVLDHGLRLVAAVPFPGQDSKWPPDTRIRYLELLGMADRVEVVEDEFSYAAFQRRNEWMVDHVDAVVAVWDGREDGGTWNCVEYAREQDVEIIRVDPNKLLS